MCSTLRVDTQCSMASAFMHVLTGDLSAGAQSAFCRWQRGTYGLLLAPDEHVSDACCCVCAQVRPADDAATHPGRPPGSEVQPVRGRRTTASPSVLPPVPSKPGPVGGTGVSERAVLLATPKASLAVQPAIIRGRPAPKRGRRANVYEGPSCPASRSVCVYGQTSCRSTSFDGLADSGCWHDLT